MRFRRSLLDRMAPKTKQPFWQRPYRYAGEKLETGKTVGAKRKSKPSSLGARQGRRQLRSAWMAGALQGAHACGKLGMSWSGYKKLVAGKPDDDSDVETDTEEHERPDAGEHEPARGSRDPPPPPPPPRGSKDVVLPPKPKLIPKQPKGPPPKSLYDSKSLYEVDNSDLEMEDRLHEDYQLELELCEEAAAEMAKLSNEAQMAAEGERFRLQEIAANDKWLRESREKETWDKDCVCICICLSVFVDEFSQLIVLTVQDAIAVVAENEAALAALSEQLDATLGRDDSPVSPAQEFV